MFGIFKRKEKRGFSSISDEILREYNSQRPAGPQKLACHAPFKNLYFGHHGNVIACCYNRDFVPGQYPAMSIKEIWTGKNAEQLREYIKLNNFTLGCSHCEMVLQSGNYDAVKAKQYDTNEFNTNGYPSVMEFELSNLCNLECVMCSGDFSSLIRAKREKLPPIKMAYDAEFVRQLDEFMPYLERMKFYGGEPFLIEIYYDIWKRAKELNPRIQVQVQTNATVLSRRAKEMMENFNFHINVSIDSLKKENYERIRKNADFDQVMSNITYFYNYCKSRKTTFGISVCGMQQNWQEIPDFVNYCNKLDVELYIHPVFDPLNCALMSLTTEKLLPVIDYLQGFDFPVDTPAQKKNRKHFQDFVNQIISWSNAGGNIPEQRKPITMDELKEKLERHVQMDLFMTKKEKTEKIETLRTRFAEIESKAEYQVIKLVLSRVNTADVHARAATIRHFEDYLAPQLLEISKSELEKGMLS